MEKVKKRGLPWQSTLSLQGCGFDSCSGNYDNACHSAKKEKKKEKKFIPKIKEYKEVLEINNAKANIPPNGQRLKDT